MGRSASRRGQCFQRGALRSARQPEALHRPANKLRKRFPWLRPGRGFSRFPGRSASPDEPFHRARKGALRFNWAANPKRFVGSSDQVNREALPPPVARTGPGFFSLPRAKRFPLVEPCEPENGSASFPSRLKRAKRSGSDGQQIGKALFLKIRNGRSASFSRAAKRKKRFGLTGSPTRSASPEINLPDSVPFLVPPVKRFAVERETYRRP